MLGLDAVLEVGVGVACGGVGDAAGEACWHEVEQAVYGKEGRRWRSGGRRAGSLRFRSQHLPSRLTSVVYWGGCRAPSRLSTPVDSAWSLPGAPAMRTQFESAVVQQLAGPF